MQAFADLIFPITPEEFFADWYGKRPLHIAATDERRRQVLDWARLNEILSAKVYWSENHLKLFLDGRKLPAEDYCDAVTTLDGRRLRADPAKVKLYLSIGASLVANAVDPLTPEMRAVGRILEEELVGYTAANLYCSFQGRRAFATHFDTHEVFAIHTEGEKVWRIYEGRETAPVTKAGGVTEAPRDHEQRRGKVLFEVTLRPGDLLYIPRGQYHDALASSEASLHVTFSVEPMTGLNLFRLLEREAARDPLFRDWLPHPRAGDGAELRARLGELGERLKALTSAPDFAGQVQARQRSALGGRVEYDLPNVRPMHGWDVSAAGARVDRGPDGWVLAAGGRRIPVGALHEAAAWILARPVFGTEELEAWFPSAPRADLHGLIETFARAGLVKQRP
jgi:mannose-6-phosphate isomerase-like protein (cupin superfamily)